MSKKFQLLNNYEITISDELENYNIYHVLFSNKSWECYNSFFDIISEYSDINELMDDLYEISCYLINTSVELAVGILTKFNIWNISKNTFINEYGSYFDIGDAYNRCVFVYSKIIDEYNSLAEYRSIERSSRSKWSGGGFGITGAVKGAISAGILNAATSAFRFVTDSVTDSFDQKKINTKINQFVNDFLLDDYIYDVKNACYTVGIALYDLLERLNIVDHINLDYESVEAIVSNIKHYSKSKEESVSMLLHCLSIFPYDFEIYELLFELTYKYDLSVANMAEYFGFGNELAQYYENDFKDESWENIITYIKNNNSCEKSKLFEDFLKNKHLMNNDNTWNTRLIQAFNIDRLYKEAKEMYEYLKQLDKERY